MIPSRVPSPLAFVLSLFFVFGLLGCAAHRATVEARRAALAGAAARPPAVTTPVAALGSVEVTVTDASGAPQPFVDVRLRASDGSSPERIELADESGRATFAGLPPGDCMVNAMADGQVSSVARVAVAPGLVARATVAMSPSRDHEQVVNVNAPLAEAVNATAPRKPPLVNRRIEDIVAMMPAIVRTGGANHAGGGLAMPAPPSAITSFRLITSGASAKYGEQSTGVATIAGIQPPAHARSGERYQSAGENPFRSPLDAPLSTFGVDVDTASYAIARSWITGGELPPADAVRVEEFVNAFSYGDAPPAGGGAFRTSTEVAGCPWAPAHRLVRVAIKGAVVDERDLPPSNLVFLVDVSGSMHAADKLELVKASLLLLVDRLRAEDTVGLVVYAGAAGVVLEPTSGARKPAIREAIERLAAGGTTAGAAGIRAAYALAEKHLRPRGINRVILATDGDFNVGVSSDAELVRLIEAEREKGVFLTVLGFGTGNYQDAKMEQLADHGNGNYAYVDTLDEARRVLVAEAAGTLFTIAKDVKIQVEMNPARVASYRLIGYENRVMPDEDFEDDTRDGGEIGAGHSVTALYEIVPAGIAGPAKRKAAGLRYQEGPEPSRVAETSGELMTVKVRWKLPDGRTSDLQEAAVLDDGASFDEASDDLRWSASAAAFSMMLQGSKHVAGLTWPQLTTLASSSIGHDADGRRAGMLDLIRQASSLQPPQLGALGR